MRTGPELEIPGYGALDHHLEGDTFGHSWEVLALSSAMRFAKICPPIWAWAAGIAMFDTTVAFFAHTSEYEEVVEKVTGQQISTEKELHILDPMSEI